MIKLRSPHAAAVLLALACTFSFNTLSPNCFAGQITMYPQPEPAAITSSPDFKKLMNYDIVFVVDKSESMQRKDCFQMPDANEELALSSERPDRHLTRWQWCQNQIANLFRLGGKSFPLSKLILFSDDFKVYENVGADDLASAFMDNKPRGTTQAAKAITPQLRQYFANKARFGDVTRPMMIVVISDGGLSSKLPLRRAIIEATDQMERPDEIAITFLRIGHDIRSENLAHELNKKPSRATGKFNIVSVKEFDEINQIGLARALIDATHPQPVASQQTASSTAQDTL